MVAWVNPFSAWVQRPVVGQHPPQAVRGDLHRRAGDLAERRVRRAGRAEEHRQADHALPADRGHLDQHPVIGHADHGEHRGCRRGGPGGQRCDNQVPPRRRAAGGDPGEDLADLAVRAIWCRTSAGGTYPAAHICTRPGWCAGQRDRSRGARGARVRRN
jgi:hypothetical protein